MRRAWHMAHGTWHMAMIYCGFRDREQIAMICSMTGFAAASRETPAGSFSVELRSVNHRFLEINFRIDDNLRSLEPLAREKISSALRRGKVDCRLNFRPSTNELQKIKPDMGMVYALLELNHHLLDLDGELTPLGIADILHWPQVLAEHQIDTQQAQTTTIEILVEALSQLQESRNREGEKLKRILLDHLDSIQEIINEARPLLPKIIQAWQEKMTARLIEAVGNAEDERIRQEMVIFIQRIDLEEEISRINTHISETRHLLEIGGAQGKRLDFLMQELNREANTLGSKSVNTQLTGIAMDLKVRIEQMREQIQNIE